MKKLPNLVIVHVDSDRSGTEYLTVSESLVEASPPVSEQRTVGVYKLVNRRLITTLPHVIKELPVK